MTDGSNPALDQRPNVELSASNFGDVIAVVDDPHSPAIPAKRLQDYVAEVAGLGVFGLPGSAVELVLLLSKKTATGGSPSHVALLSRSDAMRLVNHRAVRFPEGEPIAGEVYARHPVRRNDYWPFADFHRLLLHEKSVEVARYLLALGAADVTIRCKIGSGKNPNASVKLDTPTPVDVSAGMGFALDDSGDLTIAITGAGRSSQIPADLIWPGHDPLFKLAQDAARAGAVDFRFGIKTDQSRSVNATASARLKGLGLSLGGDYKRWEDLTFTVDARFPSMTDASNSAANL